MIPIAITATKIHPPVRTQVDITDRADADEFLEDIYGVSLRLSHQPPARREGPLVTHARTAVGPFAIDEISVAGGLEASPDPLNAVAAVWTKCGHVAGRCDGLTSEARADDVVMLSQPDLPHHARAQDVRVMSVLLDPSVVSSVATGLPSSQAPSSIRFTSLQPVAAAAERLWKSTVTYVKHTVLADDALATPLVLGQTSRLLTAVMLSTFPNALTAPPAMHDRTDAKPVLLRRAIEFMDTNVSSDICLADIAQAVHVTPRAVQYMFRRHLETTPLQYLRRLRLHYAHLDLVSGDRMHTTVTEIAARWGFAHTGRFAVLYRETYGQSPHTTLRK